MNYKIYYINEYLVTTGVTAQMPQAVKNLSFYLEEEPQGSYPQEFKSLLRSTVE